ncbi:hypothetical protein H696_05433 [Fonticula alba]|uniref:TNFR-Cys domain-containing protein n=1 Tax=Fonticula alba TaxID=691883 RepID=A0A058Z171_FONAL|nr:hypothetical protein H696_05433 [Fonticula alba]KCV67975.1 hypothetical protein H696_05433 [Fonticula alba]|eukprot:XP_009497542.1 hypothetical protein H696_05433 [Fonticula alba]
MPGPAPAPRAPPAPLLLLTLLLLLLPQLVLTAGSSHGQDLFLHAAPRPVSLAPGPYTFPTGPGSHSMAMARVSDSTFNLMPQIDLLDKLPEVRWGVFFGSASYVLSCGRPDCPGSLSVMALAPLDGTLPTLVAVTPHTVGFWTHAEEHPLPVPNTELLAGVAFSEGEVLLLGATGMPGQSQSIYLGTLHRDGLDPVSHELPTFMGSAQAVPGIRGSFYMYWGPNILRLAVDQQGSVPWSASSMEADILSAVVTRVVPPIGDCQLSGDLVMLLANGQLSMEPCAGILQGSGTVFLELPTGLPASGGWLLAAPAAATGNHPQPVYLVVPDVGDPRDRLWRLTSQDAQLSWRRVILPPVVDNVWDLQLVQLRVGLNSTGIWALVFGELVLFEARTFGCQEDGSIRCDSDTVTTGSPAGWTCAAGHAESPFTSPDHLCAGCAEGWYLDRPAGEVPFSGAGHACRPCAAANCRTCNAEHCLLCTEDLLLEPTGPEGRIVCVPSCSAGFVPMAGACRPAAAPPAGIGLSVPAARPALGLDPGDRVTSIAESWLSVDPATGSLVIPSADTASGASQQVLLFTADRRTFLMPTGDLARPGGPPAREVVLFAPGLESPVKASAEIGPFLYEGTTRYLVALCNEVGQSRVIMLSCVGVGPCSVDTSRLDNLPTGSCAGLRRASPRIAVLAMFTTSLMAVWVEDHSPGAQFVITEANGMVGFPGARSAGNRADPGPGEWLLWTRESYKATALPMSLAGRDSRANTMLGHFVPSLPSRANAFEPVFLPRGAEGLAPGELFLSRVTNQEWLAIRVPGDMLPAGRSIDLGSVQQRLGTLPRAVQPVQHTLMKWVMQGLALPAGDPRYPSVLLLLTRTFIGASLMHCPAGAAGPCVLLPAVFVDVPPGMEIPSTSGLWLPAIGQAPEPAGAVALQAATLQPGKALELVLFAPGPGMVAVSLEVLCPPGMGGSMCDPCHGTCAECRRAGDPLACTACPQGRHLHRGTCVDRCPAGTWPDDAARACAACPAGCAECSPAGQAAACTRCMDRHFLSGDASCRACDGSCAECQAAGSCSACQPGMVFLLPDEQASSLCGSTCLPGQYVGAGRCAECDASCELCTGEPGRCQVCAEGFRRCC